MDMKTSGFITSRKSSFQSSECRLGSACRVNGVVDMTNPFSDNDLIQTNPFTCTTVDVSIPSADNLQMCDTCAFSDASTETITAGENHGIYLLLVYFPRTIFLHRYPIP